MKRIKQFTKLFFLLVFLTSCKISQNNENPIINSDGKSNNNNNLEKKKMEIKFSCGEDGISEYLDDGWVILKEDSQEKICTWKSVPATKDCDMEKDKGCKLTKPDKIGVEKTYLLEK
ncbi:alpha-2-macroglobulin [Prochlorococcus marinus str. MU1402]|uniref:alpha-2-macroglobulin n=1 Tax=Prochlorococcus marinus TaxID=1219 RepID=UPI001AD9F4FA|nr:alpha-2-macroglobulin [Prochlorococcus marinus]MBO8231801.1 alpha-2-macroglobulin [Prochlorococcus marinus XMU1402]MBW3056551.1 alpha-2-macroglobulin [Prochlorococcus marinus str. MU1402]